MDGVRYQMHRAGPDCSGLVILFHGKVKNLAAETEALAKAYVQSLRLDVCVVDYRQRASCLGLDAQLCLESLEEISGSSTGPVVIHGIGLGSSLAVHMAMVAQVMPAALDRRLRLLVLDGGMGAVHMNVGCTTKDPIANDSKLAFVRMPVCLVGGDDPLFGLTCNEEQWNQLTHLCAELARDKRIPKFTEFGGTSLESGHGGARRLSPELFKAVSASLEQPLESRSSERGQEFMSEVLNASEEFSQERQDFAGVPQWTPKKGSSPKIQLESICQGILQASAGVKDELAEARALKGPEQARKLVVAMVTAAGPSLKAHGGFKSGVRPDAVRGGHVLDLRVLLRPRKPPHEGA